MPDSETFCGTGRSIMPGPESVTNPEGEEENT